MRVFRIFLVIVFAGLSGVYAADSGAGTAAASFMKIPASSARSQALGDLGSVLIEGAEGMPLNPSSIASSQMRELTFSYLNWFQDYSGQYLGYVHPIGQAVIGLNIAYYGMENFDIRDSDGKSLYGDNVKIKNWYGSFTVSKAFFLERFLLGASIKKVVEDNYYKSYGNVVFDLGATIKIGRKFILGWSGQNFSGDEKEVVKIQRLGLAWNINPFLTAAFENKSYSDVKSKLSFGMEINLPEEILRVGRVSLRFGYNPMDDHGQNIDDGFLDRFGLNETRGWTFGFGIYTLRPGGYGFGVDYSLVPYGALGKSSQVAVKFQF